MLQGKSQSGLEKLNYKLAYYTVVIINITACGPSKFNRAVTVRATGPGIFFHPPNQTFTADAYKKHSKHSPLDEWYSGVFRKTFFFFLQRTCHTFGKVLSQGLCYNYILRPANKVKKKIMNDKSGNQ